MRPQGQFRRQSRRTAFALWLVVAWAIPIAALQAGDDAVDYTVPGSDGVSKVETSAGDALFVLLRPSLDLVSWRTEPVGLRLRLGFLVSTPFASEGELDIAGARVSALVPGIEGVLRIGDRSLIRPFFDLGASWVTEGDDAIVLGTGVVTEHVFPAGRFEVGLEPGIDFRAVYAGASTNEATGNFQLAGDARHPLGFTIAGRHPELGGYARANYLFEGLKLSSPGEEDVTIRGFVEVGAIFGFKDRPKILFIRLPTIGFGYRFGQIRGFTVRVGGDRLLRLPAPPTTDPP